MRSPVAIGLCIAAVLALLIAGCSRGKERDETGQAPARESAERSKGCDDVPSAANLKKLLQGAPNQNGGDAGGPNHSKYMWAAVVDRNGKLCAIAVSTDDAAATWPGSRGIAIAKAFTANAFSTDAMPLSTARLYTLSQPGHSLWGAGAGNPLHPECLSSPDKPNAGIGQVCGGTIVFGGGLPLYKGQTRVGGLGVSGDTACTDHEIAKRVREAAGLNPPQGPSVDDITFSSVDGPTPFSHPLCANTFRNGQKVGDDAPASGY